MPERGGGKRRGRHSTKSPGTTKLYGAVDLGTNNCRLLIAEARNSGFRPVDSHSQAVRLGAGLVHEGRITEAAMSRAFDALGAIREKLKSHGVGRIKCVATQACREAANGKEFISQVQKEIGLSFKIIAPKEEARLSVIGCHNLFDLQKEIALVIDIGGGSTELSWVEVTPLRQGGLGDMLKRVPLINWATFQMGVVTLTERHQDLPEEERYGAMKATALDMLSGYRHGAQLRDRMLNEPSHLIGTSGTVTSLAAVHMGLDRYVRSAVDGQWLECADILDVAKRLADMSLEKRRELPCIGGDRSELIVAGCAILDAVLETWPTEKIRVADRGLREGVLLSMMYGPKSSRSRQRKRRRKTNGAANPAQAAASGGQNGR